MRYVATDVRSAWERAVRLEIAAVAGEFRLATLGAVVIKGAMSESGVWLMGTLEWGGASLFNCVACRPPARVEFFGRRLRRIRRRLWLQMREMFDCSPQAWKPYVLLEGAYGMLLPKLFFVDASGGMP